MQTFIHATLVRVTDPFPSPSNVDTSKLTPGPWGGLLFTVLAVATFFLVRSMMKHIKRIDFPEDQN